MLVLKSIKVNATAKQAFSVISDFESYPNFLPEIISAKVLKKTAKSVTAAFKIKLFTTAEYTLKFRLHPPKKLEWNLVSGGYMTLNDGIWDIEEVSKNKLKITYSAEINFSWLVPKKIAESLIVDHLPKMLNCFKKRIEKLPQHAS